MQSNILKTITLAFLLTMLYAENSFAQGSDNLTIPYGKYLGSHTVTHQKILINGWDSNLQTDYLGFYVAGNGYYNQFEKMRILQNGNVGIGTSTPEAKLQVEGKTLSSEVQVSTGKLTLAYGQYIGNHSVTHSKILYNGWDSNLQTDYLSLHVAGNSNNNALEKMRILQNGNVGIGTSTPEAKLQVEGKILSSEVQVGTSNLTLPYGQYIGNHSVTHKKILFNGWDSDLQTDYLGLYVAGNGGANEQEKMRILQNGNIGIGTSSPKAKLHVNGTILASEVKVSTSAAQVPDFVFKKNYELMSLNEVDAFVKQYNHLPHFPSAAEMEAKDMNLSEMNLKLLQTIEELTLHTIQQSKLIETQEQKLDAQQQNQAAIHHELNQLKTELENIKSKLGD